MIAEGQENSQWYYRKDKSGEQLGPYTRDEINLMVGQGKIEANDFIWCNNFTDWVEASTIEELFPRIETPPPFKRDLVVPEGNRMGIRIAAILQIAIMTPLWAFITFIQFLLMLEQDTGFSIIVGWNTVVTIATAAIGIGIWRTSHWAYSWGVGTSVIGAIHYSLLGFNQTSFFYFMSVIEIAIFTLLVVNRRFFKKETY